MRLCVLCGCSSLAVAAGIVCVSPKAARVDGTAPEALLDTYDVERRAAISDTTAASLDNYQAVLRTSAALGADVSHLEAVLGVMAAPPAKYLPLSAQRTMVTNALGVGRSQFRFLDGQNPFAVARRARAQASVQHDGLALLFPGLDLGHRSSSAIVDSEDVAETPGQLQTGGVADPFGFTPRVQAGVRLPHRQILVHPVPAGVAVGDTDAGGTFEPDGGANANGDTSCGDGEGPASTLDLVALLNAGDLLLLAWGAEHITLPDTGAWGGRIVLVTVGTGGAPPMPLGNDQHPRRVLAQWADGGGAVDGGFDEQGGLALVRPDRMTAWSSAGSPDPAAQGRLRTILNAVFAEPFPGEASS